MSRKNLPLRTLFQTLLLVAALPACSGLDPRGGIETEILFRGNFCGISTPQLRLIETQAAFDKLLAQSSLSREGKSAAELDLESDTIIQVAIGSRPTAGYVYFLSDAFQAEERVVLRIRERAPAADAMLAQVITQPCLLLRLPGRDYSAIRVESEQGELIGELTL